MRAQGPRATGAWSWGEEASRATTSCWMLCSALRRTSARNAAGKRAARSDMRVSSASHSAGSPTSPSPRLNSCAYSPPIRSVCDTSGSLELLVCCPDSNSAAMSRTISSSMSNRTWSTSRASDTTGTFLDTASAFT
eukprot:3073732-Rhodomonas_salina.1